MRKAIITGSFDPITSGHRDLIIRASRIFDQVTVLVVGNTEKSCGLFTPAERLELINLVIADMPVENADAILFDGLTSDAAHEIG
ncbi:MAG: pantetheine-phosphate adenylyltransferase, partial [Ruminococcaceae bacterium]|nr:pantetheine-phosphate adenylyltransferase [Oscillospiraceae bacterium]